jgi:long-chain acyl-CoA synthetase
MSHALSTEPQTLPELLLTRARELADEPIVRDARQTWSYGELAYRVAEVAAGLRTLGVGPGDVVDPVAGGRVQPGQPGSHRPRDRGDPW